MFLVTRAITVLAQGKRRQDTAIGRGNTGGHGRTVVIFPCNPSRSTG